MSDATGVPESRIQHIGSTAVEGLPAKPILDFDVGTTPSEDVEVVVSRLIAFGFVDRGSGRGGPGRLLVWESAPETRIAHVHVISFESEAWRRDLAFRDALRADSDLRRRYARVKADLAARFPDDRQSYREGKEDFILRALAAILQSSGPEEAR